ncbi:thioredoxin family protein [Chitinophaga oryzae]|uniref:Thioredoxin family protein n=1 Tax=Chitinophaga oryzae TaxID=2725414 RepID=A0ABX6LGH0_9BACT|nr:thioredoxin family protein [Chitinophaga oryzae]QJB39077.1 thioredoxin family protein [Chitinophaga oryzae]
MKTISKIFVFLLFLLSNKILVAQSDGVKFDNLTSLEDIKSKALSEKKLIFIDLFATWCSPCKEMDQDVYIDKTVGDYINKKFISIKLQIDSTKTDSRETQLKYALAREMNTKYSVKLYPTFLFLSSNGDLLHRDQGYHPSDKFIEICQEASDQTKNYASLEKRFQQGELAGDDLLKFAFKLSSYRNDSMAIIVAQKYKTTVLDTSSPKQILTPSFSRFYEKFPSLLTVNSSILKWMHKHSEESDIAVGVKGFTDHVLKNIIGRDIVSKRLTSLTPSSTPSWEAIKNEIAINWDNNTADRIIIDSKVNWYRSHKQWDSTIKYQIIQIDQLPSTQYNVIQAAAINNFIWDIVLKHSKDSFSLTRSCEYMENINAQYPNNAQFLDTYANTLYKSGKKSKAIAVERNALNIIKSSPQQEDIDIYKQTLKKMENNETIIN